MIWNSTDAIRRAEEFLSNDAPPVIDGARGEQAIEINCEALRNFAITAGMAAKLLHKHWPDYDRKQLRRKVRDAYKALEDEPVEIDTSFQESIDQFKVNQHGKPIATDPQNIRVALYKLDVRLNYDAFGRKAMIDGLDGFGPILQDEAVRDLRFLLRDRFGFLPDKELLFEFMLREARANSFHPVRDYFDKVQAGWDQRERLDRFLIDYAGAEDTEFVRAVGALSFIAAVRRIREPGAKFDEMLVLESGQGKDKSSALEIMAVRKEWFSDSFPLSADNRETLEMLTGKLIIECAELQGMKKTEIEHVKAMLSRNTDRGRPVWNRIQVEQPRECVFIGTSNSRDYLKDQSGNRRFWPVSVKQFNLDALRRDRDQLWGEAAFTEALGYSIRLDRSLWGAAAKEQAKRLDVATDPFTDTLSNYLADITGKITTEDAWLILGLQPGQRTQALNARFGAALKFLGWKQSTVWLGHRSARGFVRGAATNAQPHRRIVVTRQADRSVEIGYEDQAEA